MKLSLGQCRSQLARIVNPSSLVVLLWTTHLLADDHQAQIEIDLGGIVIQALDEIGGSVAEVPEDDAKDADEAPAEGGAIQIDGFGGGIELPDNFKQMMKAAQEVQAIKAKYDATVAELIVEAKKLSDPDEIMAGAAKVAALANQAEQLRLDMDAKQKEMMKNLGGGGIFGDGGFGGGGIGGGDIDVKILPVFPKGGLPLPRIDPPM